MKNKLKPLFEGWYYKQQVNGKTLAIIPGRSNEHAFVHVISDNYSCSVKYDLPEYKKNGILQIGENEFSGTGIKLNIKNKDILLKGELAYSCLTPIKSDIMGIFGLFPMECRHEIISMRHNVSGGIIINGEKINFNNGIGYIEGDSGYSFPEEYAWVHCNDFNSDCSITAAIARIPFAGLKFWGCICIVWYEGKEYRLATYKGAKIIRCDNGIMEIKQGNFRLIVSVKRQNSLNLPAPQEGKMNRIIKESPSCPANFTFTVKNRSIFTGDSECASYEYVMQS